MATLQKSKPKRKSKVHSSESDDSITKLNAKTQHMDDGINQTVELFAVEKGRVEQSNESKNDIGATQDGNENQMVNQSQPESETESVASSARSMLQKLKNNAVYPSETEMPPINDAQHKDQHIINLRHLQAWQGEFEEAETEFMTPRPNSAPSNRNNALKIARPQSAPSTHNKVSKMKQHALTALVIESSETKTTHTEGSIQSWNEKDIPEEEDEHNFEDVQQKKASTSRKPILAPLSEQLDSAGEEADEDSRSTLADNELQLAPPRLSGQHQAYLPYTFARDCITKVLNDMKKMKAEHFRIVEEMQAHYKTIEEDTQGQFNEYVLAMRLEYNKKVEFLKAYLEQQQNDREAKHKESCEVLKSLKVRNSNLVKEKRDILLKAKDQLKIFDNEKREAITSLTLMLNKQYKELSQGDKLLQIEKDNHKGTDDQLKIKEKECETLQKTADDLQNELNKMSNTLDENKTNIELLMVNSRQQVIDTLSPQETEELNIKTTDEPVLINYIEDNTLKAEHKKIVAKNEKLTEKNIKYKQKLTNMKSENKLEILKHQAENQELKDLIDKLKDMIQSKTNSEETKKESQQLEEQRNQLEEQLNAAKEKLNVIKDNENDTRSDDVDVLTKEIESQEEKMKSVNETITVMKIIKGEKIEDLPKKSQAAEKLTDGYTQLIVELKREKSILGKNNSSLENELKHLKKELAEMDKERNVSAEHQEGNETLDLKCKELIEEMDQMKSQMKMTKENSHIAIGDLEMKLCNASHEIEQMKTQLNDANENNLKTVNELNQKMKLAKKEISQMKDAQLENVPLDTAQEIRNITEKMGQKETELDVLENKMKELLNDKQKIKLQLEKSESKLSETKKNEERVKATLQKYQDESEAKMKKTQLNNNDEKQQKIIKQQQKKIKDLEQQLRERKESRQTEAPQRESIERRESKAVIQPSPADIKIRKENEKLTEKLEQLKVKSKEDNSKIKQLEKDIKESKSKTTLSPEDRQAQKKQEKQLKDLQKSLELEKKRTDNLKNEISKSEEIFSELKKEYEQLTVITKKDKEQLSSLGIAAKEGSEAIEKVAELTTKLKNLTEDNKSLTENFNGERVLRKKYYNMIEDMKGKIRVYARARPLSKSEHDRGNYKVIKSPDEYSLVIDTQRGPREFQYDQVFTEEHSQQKVFEDTNNLIQSAVDGYNVCIFAYGQTGSGKTFTMIGDKEQNYPGIMPRAFKAIYDVVEENKKKFTFKISMYMMELYMDKLIDLFAVGSAKDSAKLDIKKDKKGMVVVQGSVVMPAKDETEMMLLFEKGSSTRHIASTKMNAESSRSHLIVSIVIESTNLTSGAVTKGKLSLVDLAGSERAAKTGASAEQLKEAQSINKSLSALGDVISALSSDQSFIPYRNNKLTMLMQDSLGGNAKTLMFVNISPADYNTDETLTSLTYASRVKLITNDASKNADNKEIARLKGVISKLKKGENIDEDDVE